MKKLLLALCVLLAFPAAALAQAPATVKICTQGATGCTPVSALAPMPSGISQGGNTAQVSLDGALAVNTPASPQFADTFSAALDTTTNWTAKNSTGTAVVSAGQLVINSSTTASAYGGVFSQQSFAPVGVGSQAWGTLASFTVLAQANSVRVFGMATVPATPTTAVPVTDGYIYRLDGTGALFAEIWSAGVAISSTNVTTACLPAANTPGIFAIIYRASLVQFTCGAAIVVNQAPILGINPANQVLPVMGLSIAGSTPPAASAVLNLSAIALSAISPGTVKSANQPATINDPYMVVGQSPNMPQTYPTLYSSQTTQIQGNASGTTGAVVGTLALAAGKTTYICDFDVSAAGTGAYTVTIAGLLGGSKVYQLVAPNVFTKSFNPCLAASAPATAITSTTSANGTATAVNVNSSGFQQ